MPALIDLDTQVTFITDPVNRTIVGFIVIRQSLNEPGCVTSAHSRDFLVRSLEKGSPLRRKRGAES